MIKLGNFVSRQTPENNAPGMRAFTSAPAVSSSADRQSRTAVYCRGRLEHKNAVFYCMVLDISAGGARIRSEHHVGPGDPVLLRIGQDFAGKAKVVWQDGDYAGIKFSDDPASVEKMIAGIVRGPAGSEIQAHVRVSVLWDAEMIVDTKAERCEILDVSIGGARVRTSAGVPVGSSVSVRCSRFGEVEAEVVWANAGELGVRFLEPTEHIFRNFGG